MGEGLKMSERLIKQDAIRTAVFGISIMSGIASSVYLAEYIERDYSPERVQEIDEEIQDIDKTVAGLLGEDECHVGIYNYLRDSNSFPTHTQNIKTELSRGCESPLDENTSRLVGSYVTDLEAFHTEKVSHVNDLRYVSVEERLAFGIVGFGVIGVALNGLGKVLHRSRRN